MNTDDGIRTRYEALKPFLNERLRRLAVAAEALTLKDVGGIERVSAATGVSRRVIRVGIEELKHPDALPAERIRQPGGGRKRETDRDPMLKVDLLKLLEASTRGDPESSLRWTSKSVRKLAAELTEMGHKTSSRMVCELLHELDYSLQANRKTKEGGEHPDRDAQFHYINDQVKAYQAAGQPTVSVDAKKKELVGDFKNTGQEWHPKGKPEDVRVYDFPIKELGKVAPYGVYDIAKNEGWVSVGTDHDTAAFAAQSIRRWWDSMGSEQYPEATQLLVTADCGGSNGYRVGLWKTELQKLANDTGLEIHVCHLPPGTSKWNKIEHRLFSFITQNWRGKPLVSHEVIVNLIASTTTRTGLKVKAEIDRGKYPTGIKISKEQLARLSVTPDDFHGDWNYVFKPQHLHAYAFQTT